MRLVTLKEMDRDFSILERKDFFFSQLTHSFFCYNLQEDYVVSGFPMCITDELYLQHILEAEDLRHLIPPEFVSLWKELMNNSLSQKELHSSREKELDAIKDWFSTSIRGRDVPNLELLLLLGVGSLDQSFLFTNYFDFLDEIVEYSQIYSTPSKRTLALSSKFYTRDFLKMATPSLCGHVSSSLETQFAFKEELENSDIAVDLIRDKCFVFSFAVTGSLNKISKLISCEFVYQNLGKEDSNYGLFRPKWSFTEKTYNLLRKHY